MFILIKYLLNIYTTFKFPFTGFSFQVQGIESSALRTDKHFKSVLLSVATDYKMLAGFSGYDVNSSICY